MTMATLIPPMVAIRPGELEGTWGNQWHLLKSSWGRMTACGLFDWRGMGMEREQVANLKATDICKACLGAMEAVDEVVDEQEQGAVTEEPLDPRLTWGSMEREGGTWEGKMEFVPPVCCPRCGSTDTPWDFTYTLHPQPCRRCGDCDWVWDPEEAMAKKIQSEKEASET